MEIRTRTEKFDVQEDAVLVAAIPGFCIPAHDYVALTYVGSTNNISTVTYKTGGASGQTVATLTLTYIGGTPSADDAKTATITLS